MTGQAIFYINYGATFNLYDEDNSGVITGGTGLSGYGGAIYGVNGTFNMYGGTITGCSVSYGGGVMVYSNGTFTMHGGTISSNEGDYYGGGVMVSSGTFTMRGGTISSNSAPYGGVMVESSGTVNLFGGSICYNSGFWGGGISSYGTVNIENNCTISHNTASGGGGGIELENGSKLYMKGGIVSYNRVTDQNGNMYKGGGIHVPNGSECHLQGDVQITNNYQGQDGVTPNNIFVRQEAMGKVFIDAQLTGNASIGVGTNSTNGGIFTGSAATAYNDASRFTSDNGDYIVGKNAAGQLLLGAPYAVTYDGNGATNGSAPTDSTIYPNGVSVTVLGNTGSLEKTDYFFEGWNTAADGSGTAYAAGDTFTITGNVTLFAQWGVPQFTGSSMVLTSVLRLQYCVEVPENFDGTGAYITFKLPNRDLQTVAWANGSRIGTTNEYAFECRVYAYQLADAVETVFHYFMDGTEYTISDNTKTAVAYLDQVIAGGDGITNTDIARAKALKNYGHYLQIYLAGLNGWTLTEGKYNGAYNQIPAVSGVNVSAARTGSASVTAMAGTPAIEPEVDWAIFLLSMTDGTDLLFEIQLNSGYAYGEIGGTVNGQTSGFKPLENNVYRLTKFSVNPNALHLRYPFHLYDGDRTLFSIQVAPMYFIQTMLSTSSNEAELNAMATLYEYWNATAAE